MGTIVPNKEKTDAFNVTRPFDQKNASNCACCNKLVREEKSKITV